MNCSDFIKNRRLELRLTLEDVGRAVGVGKSTVRKCEVGMIANMRRDKIAALARVLDLDPMDIVNLPQERATSRMEAGVMC